MKTSRTCLPITSTPRWSKIASKQDRRIELRAPRDKIFPAKEGKNSSFPLIHQRQTKGLNDMQFVAECRDLKGGHGQC